MANNVVSPEVWKRQAGVVVADGGEPPYDGGMEARVAALESTVTDIRERLAKIETRLDHTATKGDLSELRAEMHAAINAQTWKVVGSCTVLVAAVFGIAKYIH